MAMDRDSPVEMYANSWCPYCATARALLGSKGVQVTEIDIEALPERREEMIARSGRRTVPQIFIGPTHVGGYDDLAALERAGKLDLLLRGGH
jgi:glutaredoxin 3